MDPVQLDMLPLVDSVTETVTVPIAPQVAPPAKPRKPHRLKPATCDVCGQPAWDHYKYSDDEYLACYVAHHDGGAVCIQRTYRHPERHRAMPGLAYVARCPAYLNQADSERQKREAVNW